MKSNLMPLPKLDRDGLYLRWRLALDEIRYGKGRELLQKIRVVLARTFMPGFDGAGFLRDTLLDIVDVGAAGGLHRRCAPFARHIRSHLFEPEAEAYQELLRWHAGNDLIKIYPNALSRDAKLITIPSPHGPDHRACSWRTLSICARS